MSNRDKLSHTENPHVTKLYYCYGTAGQEYKPLMKILEITAGRIRNPRARKNYMSLSISFLERPVYRIIFSIFSPSASICLATFSIPFSIPSL